MENSNILSEADRIADLERRLYIHPVFGCFNRAKFEEIKKSFRGTATYFSIDANNLKMINDTFSHEHGDKLLKAVADSGMKVWGDNFFLIGGDEFGACIMGVAQSDALCIEQMKRFKDILAKINESCPELPLAAAIGYATCKDLDDISKLIESSDKMMYSDKAEYKKAHPEYDVRKAKLTPEAIQNAIADGTFSDMVREYRRQKEQESSGVEPKVYEEVDMTFEEGIQETVELFEPVQTELVTVSDEDFTGVSVADAEEAYQQNEFNSKVAPIVQETTQRAVKEAVKYQQDKLKLEVAEVLESEVGYRLSKYEKRRRRREFKERISSICKGVVILIVVLVIMGNSQLRLRFALLVKNLGDLFIGLIQNEEVESNKLVEDLFKDLGNELNETGFDINSTETESE